MKKIVLLCSVLAPCFIHAMSREAIVLQHLSKQSLIKERVLLGDKKPFLPIINLFIYNINYIEPAQRKNILESLKSENDAIFKQNVFMLQQCVQHEFEKFSKERHDLKTFELWSESWGKFVVWTCYTTLCKEYNLYEIALEVGYIYAALKTVEDNRDALQQDLSKFREKELQEEIEKEKIAKLLDFDSKSGSSVMKNWNIDNLIPSKEVKEKK